MIPNLLPPPPLSQVLVVLATGKENELWMRTGDQGASWRVSAVTLLVGTTQVVLQAERGDSFMGDVYVDDLSVTTGACAETGRTGTVNHIFPQIVFGRTEKTTR